MRVPLPVLSLMMSAGLLAAQVVENPGFADGKSGWLGDGKIVYIEADGTVSDTAKPGATQALRVELSKNSWKEIKQKLRPKADENEVSISFQAMAEAGFLRLADSKEYTKDNDWKEGGNYVWSALMYPKCDLLIRLRDDTWHYRPLSLQPWGNWKKVSEKIDSLKSRQREIVLLFPPGEGSVLIKAN